MQFLLAVVVPAVFGAITGIALGISAALYLVLAIAGLIGAIGAGLEHPGPGPGALRGILAGLVFGGAILIAHEISGAEPERDLPDPPIALLLITVGFAIPFAAIGGWLRGRMVARGATESEHEVPGPLG